MMKYLLLLGCLFQTTLYACSDVFVNTPEHHVEARTLDFLANLRFQDVKGLIGERLISQPVLNAKIIPSKQLASWTNKYGYFGRAAFEGQYIVDGMNTEGLTCSILYLPGSQFPVYSAEDKRPVLGIYDIVPLVLGKAATTSEAIKLLEDHQMVEAAAHYKDNIYIKNVPTHYVIRDRHGKSVVIEFIDGRTHIYPDAENVLTNAPPYPWQKENAEYYRTLKAEHKGYNDRFANAFHNYSYIYDKCSFPAEANLLGLPGDYTPPSRFVRSTVLLDNLPMPATHDEAIYQAMAVIDSVTVPATKGASPTLWISLRDLDQRVYYTKDLLTYEGTKLTHPQTVTGGYRVIDLKTVDFKLPTNYKPKNATSIDSSKITIKSAEDLHLL